MSHDACDLSDGAQIPVATTECPARVSACRRRTFNGSAHDRKEQKFDAAHVHMRQRAQMTARSQPASAMYAAGGTLSFCDYFLLREPPSHSSHSPLSEDPYFLGLKGGKCHVSCRSKEGSPFWHVLSFQIRFLTVLRKPSVTNRRDVFAIIPLWDTSVAISCRDRLRACTRHLPAHEAPNRRGSHTG
jgi:hypothetical protein